MKIGAYVVERQAKATYSHESFNARSWPGFLMVLNELRAAGHDVSWVGKATAYQYPVVLASITAQTDWWPFVAERINWPKSGTRVIVGGAGVLNVRPFLSFADAFWLGRGENDIVGLVAAMEGGYPYPSASVIYPPVFKPSLRYEIRQATSLYRHEVTTTRGKEYRETAIGCSHACLFCGYTWQRRHLGNDRYEQSGPVIAQGRFESALLDRAYEDPSTLRATRNVGLDGCSERLRFMCNKRISREEWRAFLRWLGGGDEKPRQIRVYNLLGLPTEREDEWGEMLEDLRIVDETCLPSGSGHQWSLVFHNTPFRAMPATPAAHWPMSYRNYRGAWHRTVRRSALASGNLVYQGRMFWAVEGYGTDGLPTVIEDALCIRGIEKDSDIIAKLASSRQYWGASLGQKVKTLEKYVDVARLFREYRREEIPTAYLGLIPHTLEHVSGSQ